MPPVRTHPRSFAGTLRIGPVEFPRAVVQALKDNRLVLFVGAGASIAPPADLPSFKDLVCQVVPGRKPEADEPFESFLGRLKEDGTDVHRLISNLIGRPDSQPNEVHKLLTGLFERPEAVRIVTTNFDRHLSGASRELWPEAHPPVYDAPALPLGDRFQGIVHLHGGLGLDPSTLVVTDADYGRAYLTEGWARRFVIKLFEEFVVLFVGYSYSDAPLKYIARGLPADFGPGRYALTDREEAKWKYLGITPVPYDLDAHHQVPELLRAWRELARRGALDAEEFIQRLCERGPDALDPSDEGSLLFYLDRKETEHLFYRHAKDKDWLGWAERHDLLDRLFEPGCVDESLRERALWFSDRALEPRGDVALRLSWNRYSLSPLLARNLSLSVGRDLANLNDKSAAWGRRAACWLQLILSRSSFREADALLGLGLPNLCPTSQAELAVWWFRLVATPELGLARPRLYGSGDIAILDLQFNSQALADISQPWEKLFKPNLDRFAPLLLPSLTAILSEANLQMRAGGAMANQSGWDPMNPLGITISECGNKREFGRRRAAILIKVTREVLDWHLRERIGLAMAFVEIWLSSESPILRRLGLYGLARTTTLGAKEKARRAIELGCFSDFQVRPEFFDLLSVVFPQLNPRERRKLLAAGRRSLGSKDDGDSYFNFLVWLERSDETCVDVRDALTKVKRRHPQFLPRERPDLDFMVGEAFSVSAESPDDAQSIRAMTPRQWLTRFDEVAAQPRSRDGRIDYLQGYLNQTREAATGDAAFGLRLASSLYEREDFSHSLWAYLLRSWGETNLDETAWQMIGTFFEPLLRSRPREFVDFLNRWSESQGGKNAPRTMWLAVVSMAERLWDSCSRDSSSISTNENQEWLIEAINSPAGKLAEVLLHALTSLREDPDARGIPREVVPLLSRMCATQEAPEELAVCVLASRLRYLKWLDEDWTREHLEPRFDWSHPRHATQAWHGFLHGYNDTSFIPLFTSAFGHLNDLEPMREQFVREMVDLAYSSEGDPYAAGWLRDFLLHSSSEDRRVFSWALGGRLRDLEPAQRAALWNGWIANYFKLRFSNSPPLEDSELAIFCEWAHHLGPFLGEMLVEFKKRQSPTISYRGNDLFFFRLKDEPIEGEDPTTGARFCTWVLRGFPLGASTREVRQVIERYIDRGAETRALEEFIDLYVEKGGDRGPELRERLRARDEKVSA